MEEVSERKNILLSICIPTYNRCEVLNQLVQECLQIKSDEVEIVVSDNHSTDDTEKLMRAINDDRFHYYRNDENIGWDNMGLSLIRGRGKFCLLIRDKDSIPNIDDWFQNVKQQLHQSEDNSVFIGSLIDPNGKYLGKSPERNCVKDTSDIYVDTLNSHTYSSAIIFPHDVVADGYETIKAAAPYFYSLYPHICIALYCAKYGNRVSMPSLTVKMQTNKVYHDAMAQKGDSNLDEPYWTLESRNKQHQDLVGLFKMLNLSDETLRTVMASLMDRQCRWFISSLRIILQRLASNAKSFVDRYQGRSITWYHSMYWDGFEMVAEQISSLHKIEIINSDTFRVAKRYYNQLVKAMEEKELNVALK